MNSLNTIVSDDSSLPHSTRPISRLNIKSGFLNGAQKMLISQADALLELSSRLDHQFEEVVHLILSRHRGRVVICGLGKSGHIGRKISATMASVGTPSFFLHASEALHGDLGMVMPEDTVILISNSGETEEVVKIAPLLQAQRIPVVSIVGHNRGTLAQISDYVLDLGIEKEACPFNLAPTTSTLLTLALGDALAMALSQAKNFREIDFAQRHPGGSLGKRLCSSVRDRMRSKELPFVSLDTSFSEIVVAISKGRAGYAIVVDEKRHLLGIITDKELRKAFEKGRDPLKCSAHDLLNPTPFALYEDTNWGEAEALMLSKQASVLVALDTANRVVGVVE